MTEFPANSYQGLPRTNLIYIANIWRTEEKAHELDPIRKSRLSHGETFICVTSVAVAVPCRASLFPDTIYQIKVKQKCILHALFRFSPQLLTGSLLFVPLLVKCVV